MVLLLSSLAVLPRIAMHQKVFVLCATDLLGVLRNNGSSHEPSIREALSQKLACLSDSAKIFIRKYKFQGNQIR